MKDVKRMKFTKRSVAVLIREPGDDDYVVWDLFTPGLGIRLRGDRKVYLAQYRVAGSHRQVKDTIGDVRKVELEHARRIARQKFAKASLGVDPATRRPKQKLPLRKLG